MFLLIPLCFPSKYVFLYIYIPLCFYLYLSGVPYLSNALIFTFHYVSTYTTRYANRYRFYLNIYIPLCFYLYLLSRSFPAGGRCIYIPLCFYLYRLSSLLRSLALLFTFHYVSPYTCTCNARCCWYFIYIPLCFYLYQLAMQPG